MASQMCKDWILETIDQLRKRKARPDVDRICHMVERKHGLSSKDIEHELETLVDAGIVVKVEYKGSTSYRNAAKWKKSHLGGNVLNSNDISRKLCTAVKCASDNNSAPTDGNAGGAASLADIEQWLSSNDAVTSLTGNDLELALTREIDQGNIKQLDSGKFMVVSEDEREKTTIQANVKGGGTSGKTPSPGRRGRPAGKRKKFKKSLPDYETEPASKTPRKESSSPTDLQSNSVTPIIIQMPPAMNGDKPRCDFCQLTADRNPQGLVEDLLVCKDCQAKAHPSCMDYSNDLARRARNSPWQCIDCKTCYVCSDSGDPDAMLFCDACDKGYHMTCHEPEVMAKPHGKWICKQCMEELGIEEEEFQKEETEDNQSLMDTNTTDLDGTSCLPTPRESPVPFQPDEIKTDVSSTQKPVNGHPTSADASEWTIEDVETFLTKLGFPDQAGAFKEQEIDGKSLLLMKRSDVLTGLSIRLGPALKIYRQVQKLQTATV